ncbi:MAG: outer membrane beta-barrel protein [Prevotellaceae bacterium]|jgi:hypothetical protein|nr:outer membrane beta-barrel protein [Prevotellaceae bacterium]
MKKLLLLCLLNFSFSAIYAQYSISAKVIDGSNNSEMAGATVRLLNVADSALINGATTNSEGIFALNNVNSGNYLLEIRFFGYQTVYQTIEVKTENLTLKPLVLQEDSQQLKEIVVQGRAVQVVMRGDTIEFNANTIRLAENSVLEDLLKKLPGVEISSDGKITVNGQEVTKIRVDGKKFFDGDNEMATKNIPAALIDKVQVIEQKSEMAQLTGFEDDDTERIINLTFKADKKRGVFGNIEAGVGSDILRAKPDWQKWNFNDNFRYNSNAFVNIINNNTQTAITAGANNTNNVRSSRGRGGVGGGNGITSSQNIGINNSTYINPKLTVGGDITFNHSANNSDTKADKETFLENGSSHRRDTTLSLTDFYSINARFELEWKKDSSNTFIFQPNIGYNYTTSYKNQDYSISNDTMLMSSGFSRNEGTKNSLNGGFTAMYNFKSQNRIGRTFTARLAGNLSGSDNTSYNKGQNGVSRILADTTLNQQTIQTSQNYSADLRLSWVEPLWNKQNLLEIVAGFKGNFSNSQKAQSNYDGTDYTVYDSIYSNTIKNQFFSETFELNYRFMQAKYNLTAGFHIEPSQQYNFVNYGDGRNRNFVNDDVINYSPTFRFQYNFDTKHNIRINYRGRTTQPSVNQLQPVKDNSNLMNETIGNPDLDPAFNHSLMLNYNRYSSKNASSLNVMLNANLVQDALVSNTILVYGGYGGKEYTQTVNAQNLPINFNAGITFNMPIFKKKINFSTSTRGGYARRYGYTADRDMTEIDDITNLPLGYENAIDNYNFSELLSLSYNNDWLEVGAKGNYRYTNTWNNFTKENAVTHDMTATGNVLVRLPLDFTISTDVNFTTRSGYKNFSKNEIIWNASIDKAFLKKSLNLSLKCFDILHQKQNIVQTIGDNYIQYSESNTLQSYFLATLTWKISKFSGMTASEATPTPTGRGGRGGGEGGGRPQM